MPRLRMPSTRNGWLLFLTAQAFLGYGLAGGCYATRLPAPASPAQIQLLRAPVLPYTVVVVPWDAASAAARHQNAQAYADATFRWLQRSGAFADVRLGTSADTDGDFTATPVGLYCNSAVIPLLTGLSLGIFPTVFVDTDCQGAVFRPLARRSPDANFLHADSVVAQQETSGRVVMGWAAVPVGALPGWTHGGARDHRRYAQQSRLAIIAQSAQLAALKKP